MNKRYIFILICILSWALVFLDRWQIRNEQIFYNIDTEKQEEKFIQTEQLLDSIMINFDDIKQQTQSDKAIIPELIKANTRKRKNEYVEENSTDAVAMQMIMPVENNQRLIENYENKIYFMTLEIQKLQQHIDSLESKNN